MISTDILIIGAGITGTALARELSRFEASVTVADQAYDVAEGATKANSGIIHAGYDARPGSRKAYYNVRGARMYPELCKRLGVPYSRCGSLVVAMDADEVPVIHRLLDRGVKNGVSGLRIVGQPELSLLEPALNKQAAAALLVPDGAIVSPYEMAFAFADDAALNGVRFDFGRQVVSVEAREDGSWHVGAGGAEYICRALVNCAGSSGAAIHNMVSEDKLAMVHRRGQYYLLDRSEQLPFSRTVFQCPSLMGKGVLISPTVHGNIIIGPNAEDIGDPLDTSTTSAGLAEVMAKARRTWPELSVRANITNFSGVRAHLTSNDFIVGPVPGKPGLFEAVGIESPGLSSAPAIAKDLADQVAGYLHLSAKKEIAEYPEPPVPFSRMTDEERRRAATEDPMYGNIICRCETVTEAEIRAAIRRPVGARSVDGVKRRTRAGMGRCQGGFCSPRVAAILADELHCSVLDITKNGGAGRLLSGTVESYLKEGFRHE